MVFKVIAFAFRNAREIVLAHRAGETHKIYSARFYIPSEKQESHNANLLMIPASRIEKPRGKWNGKRWKSHTYLWTSTLKVCVSSYIHFPLTWFSSQNLFTNILIYKYNMIIIIIIIIVSKEVNKLHIAKLSLTRRILTIFNIFF